MIQHQQIQNVRESSYRKLSLDLWSYVDPIWNMWVSKAYLYFGDGG